MSYRAGVGQRAAALFHIDGPAPAGPVIICDGCGVARSVETAHSFAAKWFLSGKPPPGWRGVRMSDGSKRWDLCPRCWKGGGE